MTSTPPDPLQVQRLVDGELEPDDRLALLRSLDENPDAWREVALAFVEDQAWAPALASAPPSGERPAVPSAPRRRPWRHLPLAAGLAAALAAGFWLGGHRGGNASPAQPAAGTAGAAEPAPFHLAVDPGRPDLTVPVYSPQAGLDRFLAELARQDRLQEAQAALHPLGVDARMATELVTRTIEDGQRLVLPVSHIQFRYRGQ